MPDNALLRYSIPMPEDAPIGGRDAEDVALHAPVLSTVKSGRLPRGGYPESFLSTWLS